MMGISRGTVERMNETSVHSLLLGVDVQYSRGREIWLDIPRLHLDGVS